MSQNKKNYIFIDEIQEIIEFERVVRSLILDENNDVYITGSNAKMLSSEIATMLSGRYISFTIHSLSYLEFLQFHKLLNSDDNLNLYFKYGGLPYLRNLELNDELVFDYLIIGYKSTDIAKVLENVVYNHLLYCSYFVKVGFHKKQEIDFVCTKNNKLLYIQVSYKFESEKTIEREFGNLLKIKDNFRKIVVSMDKNIANNYMGIEHIYIKDFLSKIF